jgi:hypothetical protein
MMTIRSVMSLLLIGVVGSIASAQTTLFNSNGFEAPGYTLGNLSGQNTWFIDGTASYSVQNTVVAGGSQAVRADGGTVTSWAFPPLNYTPATGETVRIQADLARSTPGSPTGSFGYSIDVYDSNVARTTRFGLVNNAGVIQAFVSAPFNTTTQLFDPASAPVTVLLTDAIPANQFINFDARLNYDTKNLRLFINGVDVGENIPFVTQTATNLADADFQVSTAAGAVDFGFLDNYVVTVLPVPEPFSCTAVAAVGLVGVWRLRRRVATQASL